MELLAGRARPGVGIQWDGHQVPWLGTLLSLLLLLSRFAS